MSLSVKIVEQLSQAIGAAQVVSGSAVEEGYSHIWKMDEPLKAICLTYPKSTEDVSNILRICNEAQQPVVVFGGRTNLVGGTETSGNEVVISMEKMNTITEVDVQSRTMTAEAGVILQTIQNAATENDLLFPLNFGAKGSAQIGGIVSSNAGGLRVLRYGMTRNLVLGLEVVKADGTIISSLKKIIKDNSAYDLKQLFIGSEGTLGIITKVVLRLSEKPVSRNSAYAGLKDYKQVVSLLKMMDKGLAGTLSGFELMWNSYYTKATTEPAEPKPTLPQHYPYYVLIESMGSQIEKDHEQLQNLLETALTQGLIEDGVMAHTASDLEWFWRIREDVHVISSSCDYDQHFDISLPIALIGTILDQIILNLKKIDGVNAVYTFGHVADGNIHLIVDKKDLTKDLKNSINDVVYGPLKSLGGSVSAEHGIGLHKKPYLSLCRTEEEIELMRTLKRTLDPNGILNPGKVVDI